MGRICEQLRWRRPSGALKVRECRDLLLMLEGDGRLLWVPETLAGVFRKF